jgi:hypothetical protein
VSAATPILPILCCVHNRLFIKFTPALFFQCDVVCRYGDPIDPDADIAAMQTMRSYLKPDGVALLSIPVPRSAPPSASNHSNSAFIQHLQMLFVQVGSDAVVWNLHRIYGSVRLPLLIDGWSVLASAGFEQVSLEKGKIIVTQPLMLLAPASLRSGYSWNAPAASCVVQLQQLKICDVNDADW